MEIETKASESLDHSHASPDSATSTSAVASTSVDIVVSAPNSAITEEQVTIRRDFPIFTTTTTSISSGGPIQAPELISAKGNVHSAEGDGEDARSTSSSHPFSSPNPSEQDDAHGIDGSLTHSGKEMAFFQFLGGIIHFSFRFSQDPSKEET